MTPDQTQVAAEVFPPLWYTVSLLSCLPFTAVGTWHLLRWWMSADEFPPPLDKDVPPVPWPTWAGIFGFAGLQVGMGFVIWLYAKAVSQGLVSAELPGGIAMFSPGYFLAQTLPPLIGLAVLYLYGRRSAAAVGVRTGRLFRDIGYGVFTLVAILPVCLIAYKINEVLVGAMGVKPEIHPLLEAVKDSHDLWIVGLAILQAGVLAALSEEFIYRGVLMMSLVKQTGPAAAVVLTSVVFAMVHVPIEPQAFLPLLALALALGYIAWRTRGLIAPIITHALFNMLMVLSVFYGPM
jgi:membrane protease YdiL (CAAX protease family)